MNMKIYYILLLGFFQQLLLAQEGFLDQTFGNKGITVTTVLAGNAEALAVKNVGSKIYVAGFAEVNGVSECVLLRYNSNGNIDLTFGTNGYISYPRGSGVSEIRNIDIGKDNTLILSGWMKDGSKEYAILFKTDLEGKVDNSFGTNGLAQIFISNSSYAEFRANKTVLTNDKIFIAGPSYSGLIDDIGVACFDLSGKIVDNFGVNGKFTYRLTNSVGNHEVDGLIIGKDGNLIIGGETAFSYNEENSLFLLKIDQFGKIIESFGNGGVATLTLSKDVIAGVNDITFDNLNNIITGGGAFNTDDVDNDYFLSKFSDKGILDNSFGSNGKTILSGNDNESVFDLIALPDNKIIAAGSTGGFGSKLMISRFLPNGKLDESFGTKGVTKTSFPNANFSGIASIDLDDDGNILAGGFVSETKRKVVLAKYKNNLNVGIDDNANLGFEICLYPNPYTSDLSLLNKNAEYIERIEVYDINGSLIKIISIRNNHKNIELLLNDNFPKGQYFLKIITASNSFVKQIVKN